MAIIAGSVRQDAPVGQHGGVVPRIYRPHRHTRRTEARAARWSEIDFERGLWTLPAERMKARAEHIVPLTQQAIEILTELKAAQTGDYIFFGQTPRDPITAVVIWTQCGRVTDSKASPHGWRATFRSRCADNGVEREVAEAALAHTLGGVEGAYNRDAMVERRRKVMADWAAFLAGEASAAVIQFRR